MSNKENWKEAGKSIGQSFAGLGKAILKTTRKGIDKVLDDRPAEAGEGDNIKESWSEVGQSFGHAGRSFGKAVAGTATTVVDSIEREIKKPGADAEPENPAEDAPIDVDFEEVKADIEGVCDEMEEFAEEFAGEVKATAEKAAEEFDGALDGSELKDYEEHREDE